jgi:hypothetical protein
LGVAAAQQRRVTSKQVTERFRPRLCQNQKLTPRKFGSGIPTEFFVSSDFSKVSESQPNITALW